MSLLIILLACYLETLPYVYAGGALCCKERHIGSLIMRSYKVTGPVGEPDIICRFNTIPDKSCEDKIIDRTTNRWSYSYNRAEKIPMFMFELPDGQHKVKILLTFIDDEGSMTREKVRTYSRYFYEHKKYNSETREYWQDEIELNTTNAPYTRSMNRTIKTKNSRGGSITLEYSVDLNMATIDKYCTPVIEQESTASAQATSTTSISQISTSMTANSTSPTTESSTQSQVTRRATSSNTNPEKYSETSGVTSHHVTSLPPNTNTIRSPSNFTITQQLTYQFLGIIIKLELETKVEDSLLELERSEEGKVRFKCSTLAKLVGCTRCMIEIQKLQKTHLPIKLSRPSHTRRVKRQGTSISLLRKAIRSFFHAVPQDIKLFPYGSARIVGRKDTAPEEPNKNDTILIFMIIFAVIAVFLLILLVLLYLMKTRRQTVGQLQQDPEPMAKDIEIESTTMTDAQEIETALQDKMKSGTMHEDVPLLNIAIPINIDASETTAKTEVTKDTMKVIKESDVNNTNKRKLTEEELTYVTGSLTGRTRSISEDTSKGTTKVTYPVAVAAVEKLDVQFTASCSEKETTKLAVVGHSEYDVVDKQIFKRP